MKTTHTKQNKELRKAKSKLATSYKKRIFIDSILIVLIAVSPFIAYSYLASPREDIWETPFFTLTKMDTQIRI